MSAHTHTCTIKLTSVPDKWIECGTDIANAGLECGVDCTAHPDDCVMCMMRNINIDKEAQCCGCVLHYVKMYIPVGLCAHPAHLRSHPETCCS